MTGRRKNYVAPYYPPAEPVRTPPKPMEYQLVDLLADDRITEEVSEAVRLLLPFIAKQRRLDAIAAEESELAAMQHDLERVMTRENLYLNALMEITGLKDREAVKIAARALYGEAGTDVTGTGAAEGESAGPQDDAQSERTGA